MNINIFGVGRSGTSMLHLYFSYLLAMKYGQVKCVAEPYGWLTRRGPRSVEGTRIQLETDFFLSKNQVLTERHSIFNDRIYSSNKNVPVCTKYIRANGYIPLICEDSIHTYNVLVIRKVEEVIFSLKKFNWNFLDGSLSNKNPNIQWSRFCKEINDKKILSELDIDINSIKSVDDQNAIYWFAMNKYAIDAFSKYKNFNLIRYEKVSDGIASILPILGLNENDILPVSNEVFRTKDVNFDFPLKDVDWPNFVAKAKNNVNRILDELGFGLLPIQHGTILELNLDSKPSYTKYSKKVVKTSRESDAINSSIVLKLQDEMDKILKDV